MTVLELIEKLKEMPPDWLVLKMGWNESGQTWATPEVHVATAQEQDGKPGAYSCDPYFPKGQPAVIL